MAGRKGVCGSREPPRLREELGSLEVAEVRVDLCCCKRMWVALGDPPTGEWRHGGITRRFCHGRWTSPPIVTTHLATLHKRLLALYELRLDTHYRAQPVPPQQARQVLQTVRDVIRLVQRHKWHRMEEE